MAADAPAGEVLTEAELNDPARGAERSARDPFAAADGLEPPEIQAGLLGRIAAAAIVFILVAMAAIYGLYHMLLANGTSQPVHSFPTPRLETSINPRNMPATPEPGPAPLTRPLPPAEPRLDMDRAMRAIAARGAHAYDPLPAPVAPSGRSGP